MRVDERAGGSSRPPGPTAGGPPVAGPVSARSWERSRGVLMGLMGLMALAAGAGCGDAVDPGGADAAPRQDAPRADGDAPGLESDTVSGGDVDTALAPDAPDGTADAADAAPEDTAASADATPPDAADAGGEVVCPGVPFDTSGLTVHTQDRYHIVSGLEGAGLLPRQVTVFVPAGYDPEAAPGYPVLYMHDGQNLFFPERSAFGATWGVPEAIDSQVGAGAIPPLIVVGIDNTAERLSDYTPTPDPHYGGGAAGAYLSYVTDVVKPAIDTLFATRCERAATGVVGSSLGGLVSLYFALERPDVFGRVGAVSPSLWWDGEALLEAFEAWEGGAPDRLWIDMGTAEGAAGPGPAPPGVLRVRRLRDRALERGLGHGVGLGYHEAPGATHDEPAWRARLPMILAFLYGESPAPPPDALSLALYDPNLFLDGRGRTTARVEARHGPHLRLTVANAAVTLTSPSGHIAIEGDGEVVALSAGEATLSATWAGLSAQAPVTIHAPGMVPVTFVVDVPSQTPPGAVVHLVGDHAGLGGWDPAAVPMVPLGGQRWAAARSLPAGGTILYKFTRGSWATVEANAAGGDVPNRSAGPITEGDVLEHIVPRWIDH